MSIIEKGLSVLRNKAWSAGLGNRRGYPVTYYRDAIARRLRALQRDRRRELVIRAAAKFE
jgi:hypothetical protein